MARGSLTLLLLAACMAWAVHCQDLESLEPLEALDLSAFVRAGRQFKHVDSDGSEDGVAIGLIDALQRWADALEAQISIMKNEVLGLKSSNRNLKAEVSRVREENDGLRSEVGQLRSQVQENQGNTAKDTDTIDTKVESMRNDLKVFSKSFSDFLEHYDTTTKEARSNHSELSGQFGWLKKSVKDLSSSLGSSEHNVEGVRASLDSLTSTVQVLTQTDYVLEERLRSAENQTDQMAASINKELMKVRTTLVSPSFVNEALTNLTHELDALRAGADLNVTTLAFSVKALDQSLGAGLDAARQELGEAHAALADRLAQVQGHVRRVEDDLDADLLAFRRHVMAFAQERHDELAARLDAQADVRANFSQVVLMAVNELGARLGETENALENVGPQLDVINSSITTFIGQVGGEILNLQARDEAAHAQLERLNASLTRHQVTASVHGNATVGLRDQLDAVELQLRALRGNSSRLGEAAAESSRNHSLMLGGLRALEKHFIDVKKDLFETSLGMVSLNDTVHNRVSADLASMRQAAAKARDALDKSVAGVARDTQNLHSDLLMLWNNTATLSQRVQGLAENLTEAALSLGDGIAGVSKAAQRQQAGLAAVANKTQVLEVGLAGLMNYSVSVQTNLSRLLVFAAENKAEILELKVADTSLEDKVDQLFDMHSMHTTRVTQNRGHVQANLTRLEGLTNALDAQIDAMTDRYQTLEAMFSNYVRSADEMERDVEKLKEDSVATRNHLDTVQFDLNSVKAESTGIDVFVTSIQSHISALTSNLTSVAANLTDARTDIKGNRGRIEQMNLRLDLLRANVSDNRQGLVLADDQFQVLRLNSSTLKANILGLGNYINSINTDLGKLATTFERYLGDITDNMVLLSENVTEVERKMQDDTAELRTSVQGMELINTNLKGEIATLTTKTYTMKTNLFEQQNELSALKADSESLISNFDAMQTRLAHLEEAEVSSEKIGAVLRTDVSTLRTGLTSLTNSLFNLKAQILDVETAEGRMSRLAGNLTALSSDLDKVRGEMGQLRPDLQRLTRDMNGLHDTVSDLSVTLEDTADPDRFSCAVTTDEIHQSGVITYNVCNVNHGGLMNRETGHVSIKDSGDYFLTFSANMVSVNSQAVWCALYKQSAGNEGWQVLGMINNYQRNADKMDDRDSGSLTLITPLKEGDQIWVEWRGYGDSFLYSNPYRLISFSGYMLNKAK